MKTKETYDSKYNLLKRVIDFFLASLGIFILLPVLILLAITIRIYLGKPVFFKQVRPGINEKPFTMIKFRTMIDIRDKYGKPLPDEKRLTSFGNILRKLSLDELPELINVLKGEMSIVGPRPLLMRYLPYFTCEERERFKVLPGITGLAQINGRNELNWGNRFKHDIWYVHNKSIFLDLSIIIKTISKALTGSGVVVDARSIMLDFDEERKNGMEFIKNDSN